MDEMEKAANALVPLLIAKPITLVVVGPRWEFVKNFMIPALLDKLKKEDISSFRKDNLHITLHNGSRIFCASGNGPRDFYRLAGLMLDKAWVHGRVDREGMRYLSMRFLTQSPDNIYKTYG